MIERIFFISDKEVLSGPPLPVEENVYYSILANPLVKKSLEDAYALVGQARGVSFSLTLDILEPLTGEARRFITSFFFIPYYLTLDHRPVIQLRGEFPELLREEADKLSAYLSLQGIREPLLHIIPASTTEGITAEALAAGYGQLLRQEQEGSQPIFFYASSLEILESALLCLREAEEAFRQEEPRLYSLMTVNGRLEKQMGILRAKLDSTEAELSHHRQYVEVLRSNHATKELQDYYTHEYEILPLWYKRLGHILKVLTGKRTFRSLFRDGVKKYKN